MSETCAVFGLEEFLSRNIRVKQVDADKYAILFPMFRVDGGPYRIFFVVDNGKFYLSDEGATYAELDREFELKEPDVIKNIVAILKRYGCRKHPESNAFVIECTHEDVHVKLSHLIQALSFMLNMKIFYV